MAKETTGAGAASVSPIVGVAVAGGLLVAAAVAFVAFRDPAQPPAQDERATETAAADTAGAPSAPDAAATQTVDTDADGGASSVTPPAAATVVPRFDVVRVDGTGSAVVAGQAVAGASVTLRLDGEPIELVEADQNGNFVAMLALSPSDAPRILSLEAAAPGGDATPGEGTVLIAPFDGTAVADATDTGTPPASPPAQSADRPGVGALTGTAPASPLEGDGTTAVADAPPLVPSVPGSEPEADTASAARPQAPAVLMADGDGVRVLQSPGAAPTAQTEIQLDAITYDLEGDVTLAGRGPAEGSVRVTLNNQPISMGEIGPGGQWSLGLPDVDPGTYTLRLEQLGADGTVIRTVTTPFLREDPARIRDNPMLVEPGSSVITVQSGFTLWGIAEANFGDGILYVQIFEENRGEIRDPDLIFPGQIFALPDLPRAGADQ
jgi:nucleoid-associated protein YgaU